MQILEATIAFALTLAALANVYGLRIFNACLANPELANAMIAQKTTILSTWCASTHSTVLAQP